MILSLFSLASIASSLPSRVPRGAYGSSYGPPQNFYGGGWSYSPYPSQPYGYGRESNYRPPQNNYGPPQSSYGRSSYGRQDNYYGSQGSNYGTGNKYGGPYGGNYQSGQGAAPESGVVQLGGFGGQGVFGSSNDPMGSGIQRGNLDVSSMASDVSSPQASPPVERVPEFSPSAATAGSDSVGFSSTQIQTEPALGTGASPPVQE